MNIEYIQTERHYIIKLDKKIYFLIFTSAFFDFVYFVVSLSIYKFINISGTLEQRLRGSYTINYSLFYYYVWRLPIFKHQFCSLTLIGICIIIIIITEFIFQEFNIFLSFGQFFIVFLLIFVAIFFSTLMESIEKYLFEYNGLNPFLVLMFEGIFGFILSFIYCIFNSSFNEIIKFQQNKSNSEFIILILALLLYLLLSGGKNSFRVLTTKIFSPITTTFFEYILNPFYIIYYFFSGNDFISYGKRNTVYFIINLIASVIMTFCGGVYNDFLILFCCGLERDTYKQITARSIIENQSDILFNLEDVDSEVWEVIKLILFINSKD